MKDFSETYLKKSKNNIAKSGVLCLGFFCMSLVNYGVYMLLFSSLLLCIYVLFFINRYSQNIVLYTVLTLFLLLVFSIKFVLFDIYHVATEQSVFNFGRLLSFVFLIIMFCFCKLIVISYERAKLASIIKALMIFNFFIVIVQLFFYKFSGFYLDFHYFLTGEESRALMFDNLIVNVRYTGLYVEPSNLGAVALTLHCIYCKLNRWKIDLYAFFTFFLCLLSFSTLILAVSILYFGSLFLLLTKRKIIWMFLFVTVLIFLIYLGSDSLSYQFAKFQVNIGMRINMIDIVDKREGFNKWFGYGPYGYDRLIYQLTQPDITNRIASINDMGSLVFLVIVFGYFGVVIFVSVFLLMPNIKSKIFYLIISCLKISIFHPLFLLFLAVLSSEKFKENLEVSKYKS